MTGSDDFGSGIIRCDGGEDPDRYDSDSQLVLEEGHVEGLVHKFESQAEIFPEESQSHRVAEWCAEEVEKWFDRKAVERHDTESERSGGCR